MIEIEGLSFRYQGSKSPSLQNINLHIEKGEFLLLTGKSGCGKTTLTRVLNGLCPQFYEGEISGSYLLEKENPFEMNLSEIGVKVGNVFQDPRSQFYTRNTTDEILTSMEHRNFPKELMDKRLEEVCQLLQIHDLLGKDILKLSSGEKQKIAIASACVTKPDVLVLDEPSANLDGWGTNQLYVLLKRLKSQGVTIVISEHRLHYLQELFDRMIVMEQGEITQIYSKTEAEALSSQQLIKMGLRLINLPDTVSTPQKRETGLQIKNLSFSRGKTRILKEVTVEIPKGKITVVTGENGSGKTTFCSILSGLLKEQEGEILWKEERVKKKQRLSNSFFIGQDADYQLFCPTVWEEVLLNLKPTEERKSLATDLLQTLNLYDLKERHPVSLSGGQKQRVLLIASLLRKRDILILDEPTSGLDGKHMRMIAEILKRFATQHQITIIVITHDGEFAHLIADSVLQLQQGSFSLSD